MIFDLLVFGTGVCIFFTFLGVIERVLTRFDSKED